MYIHVYILHAVLDRRHTYVQNFFAQQDSHRQFIDTLHSQDWHRHKYTHPYTHIHTCRFTHTVYRHASQPGEQLLSAFPNMYTSYSYTHTCIQAIDDLHSQANNSSALCTLGDSMGLKITCPRIAVSFSMCKWHEGHSPTYQWHLCA